MRAPRRFPNGESGADVYDRITIFEDHMIRDINAGRFSGNTTLVLVTHGLALRVFLMRWFHWTVDEFLSVYNPANAEVSAPATPRAPRLTRKERMCMCMWVPQLWPSPVPAWLQGMAAHRHAHRHAHHACMQTDATFHPRGPCKLAADR